MSRDVIFGSYNPMELIVKIASSSSRESKATLKIHKRINELHNEFKLILIIKIKKMINQTNLKLKSH